MYSQNSEEEIILNNVPPNGTFLDIGAFDGKHYSNTYALADMGWAGVCVEPDPFNFCRLQECYGANQRITLVNALIGNSWELSKFWVSKDLYSTTYESNMKRWEGEISFQLTYSTIIPMSVFAAGFPGPYDFISIDTEGSSPKLLYLLPLRTFRPSLVCVEHDGEQELINAYMSPNGFECIHCNGENMIFLLIK